MIKFNKKVRKIMKNNKKLEKSEIMQAHLRMRIRILQKNRELIIRPLLA